MNTRVKLLKVIRNGEQFNMGIWLWGRDYAAEMMEGNMSQIILKAENIRKYYGSKGNITKAVDDISFEMGKGEFVGIMGVSGSGKTTILNCISTIDTVTAYENIALALSILKVSEKEIEKRIQEIAELLDIGEVLGKYPYEMSGGQQQRIAAARAIITKPALVLAGIYTAAALLAVMDKVSVFFNMEIRASMIVTLFVLLLIYGGYYVATFASCERIIFSGMEVE